MATTKITDLTAYTDPVNTDVLPIVDVTSDVTKKVSIANVMKNASQGTAAAPGIAFDGDSNTGIYSPGANQVAITTDGTQRLLIDSAGAVTIAGDLTVNGTTTNINTQNLIVEDKNVVLGDVAVPTDVTADGGGITLKGTTDKTINWVDSTDAWTSSERFSYPTGSAAAPTLTFTGDTNTGIYSPGADQVAISTGGSGRLFVDASGNVGVGTSPSQLFHVAGASPVALLAASSGVGTLRLTRSTTTADLSVSTSLASLATTSATDLAFSTNNTERLRITSAGLVGVGTSSPSSLMHLQTTSANVVLQMLENNGSTVYGASIDAFNSSGGNIRLRLHDSGGTYQERLRITSTGNVGIGTSAPRSLLSLSSSTGSDITLERSGGTVVASDNYGTISWYGNDATGGASGIRGSIQGLSRGSSGEMAITFSTASAGGSSTERMRIEATGNVGIGTTSPSTQLHILKSTANAEFQVESTFAGGDARLNLYANSSGVSQIRFGDESSANVGLLTYEHTSDSLAFRTNGSERARIDSSGRLLLGTSTVTTTANTSTNNLIAVESTNNYVGVSFAANCNDANGSYLVLKKSRGTSTGSTTVVQSGDEIGNIFFEGTDGSASRSAAAIRVFVDGTPGASDMPGRLVFSTTADGASSPTERLRIDSSGNIGIRAASSTIEAQLDITNVSGTGGLVVKRTTTIAGGPSIQLLTSSTTGQLRHTGDLQILGAAVGGTPSEIARFTTAGQLRLAGAGITFNGDTAAANELDDYEEGTWTPTITGSTTAGTIGYDSQVGKYTKIGRQVTVSCNCDTGVVTTAPTGNIRVAGLPFTCVSGSEFKGAAELRGIPFPASTTYVVAEGVGGQTYVEFFACGSDVNASRVQADSLATDDYIRFTLTYFV